MLVLNPQVGQRGTVSDELVGILAMLQFDEHVEYSLIKFTFAFMLAASRVYCLSAALRCQAAAAIVAQARIAEVEHRILRIVVLIRGEIQKCL